MDVSEKVIVTIDQELNLFSLITTMLKHRQLIVMHVTRLRFGHDLKGKFKRWYLLQMILKSEYSLVELKFLITNRATKDL